MSLTNIVAGTWVESEQWEMLIFSSLSFSSPSSSFFPSLVPKTEAKPLPILGKKSTVKLLSHLSLGTLLSDSSLRLWATLLFLVREGCERSITYSLFHEQSPFVFLAALKHSPTIFITKASVSTHPRFCKKSCHITFCGLFGSDTSSSFWLLNLWFTLKKTSSDRWELPHGHLLSWFSFRFK